jgi:hypothetical protein
MENFSRKFRQTRDRIELEWHRTLPWWNTIRSKYRPWCEHDKGHHRRVLWYAKLNDQRVREAHTDRKLEGK